MSTNSALTGESVPVDKTVDPLPAGTGDLVADRRNMVSRGTAVTYGRGRAVVTATGMQTALGAIADMLQSHNPPPTPLQKRLAVLGRRLAVAALVVCLVVFVAGVARGEPVSLMFLTAVSLAVAAIPEALPAVVTLSLALGAQRMVRRHAIVRKLPAVETLGSVTVICTDKTGTLTQGSMVVERVWTPSAEYDVTGPPDHPEGSIRQAGLEIDVAEDPELGALLRAAVLCNDAELTAPPVAGAPWTWSGDPTEVALLMLAERGALDRRALVRAHPREDEVPFDADRKRMTTLHRDPDRGFVVAAKGAPEALLPLVELDPEQRRRVGEQATAYAEDGYRVLAIAGRARDGRPDHAADVEDGLVLHGLVAMADPPRTEAAAAVAACRMAGIRPVMITGDHPATARAIADRIGVLGEHRVMTGTELAGTGPEGLADQVGDVAVYARTTPRQKLDIVGAWKARGDVVAMTGDGVNDAPALRRADIGVAMGITGTEVSKEAADMVLTDDDFATIVHAVEEGRRVYDNVRRFVRYTLTSNSGEIWVMFLAPFLGLPLPLLPVQILWINLVTDGLPGLALGVEPPERDVMQRPPRDPAESIFARGLWQHVLVVGLLMGGIPLALGLWAFHAGRPWQTMIFASLALLQLGHALAVRSERESLFRLGLRTNTPLLASVVGTVLLQLVVVYWGPLQTMFRTEALEPGELGIVLLASTIVFWAVELEKLVRRRSSQRDQDGRTASRSTSV